MAEIITLVIDIALGGLAYRLARTTAQDVRALQATVVDLIKRVVKLESK